MKLLLKIALSQKKHLSLILAAWLALIGLTCSSALEMFALGVISNKTSLSSDSVINSEKKLVNPLNTQIKKIESLIKEKKHLFDQKDHLISILVVLIFIVGLKALSLFYSRYFTGVLSTKISKDLREEYFQHLQKLSMDFYEQHNIGMIASRVATDANQIAYSLNAFLTNYLHTPFRILLSLVICFMISWELSLVIFIGLPLIVLPVILLTRKVKSITRQLQKNQERFTTVLLDFLAGIQTVKIFSMENFTFKKYKQQNDQMASLEIKTAKYDLLIRPILHTITILCVIGILFFGLYILSMSLSELLMFCGFLHQFYEPVKKFSEENAIIQKGCVAAERLFEVLKTEGNENVSEKGIEINAFNQTLEFQNVWFKYLDRWILKDLCFSIKKGEMVAIVGATGAGKSTIVNLLPRLYEIQKGSIKVDGVSIKEIKKSSLRKLFSFVSQKPFLFLDTIRANINYGNDFSNTTTEEAAKKAQAEEFISLYPEKYDTILSEAGKNLSGGQQQRLTIARALAKNAPILILDEATSSLDAFSERAIKNTILDLKGSITQIIIAHRFSTIEHADKIIFLEKGEVKALGTKDELLASCDSFKQMWKLNYHLDENLQEMELV